MKKFVLAILSLLLLFGMTGCGGATPELPEIKAIMQRNSAPAEGPDYWLLRPGKRPKHIGAFSPDEMKRYQVDCSQIKASVVDNQVNNQIETILILDDAGAPVQDALLSSIVQTAAASIPHQIYEFSIIELQGYYFAFIKLNVNWSDPCYLYQYDCDTNTMQTLAQWDDADLIGLALEGSA